MTAEATGYAQDIITFARDNAAWIPPIVFALGLAESLVVVSLFVPSTILFLAIGAAHSAAGGDFLPIWIAGATGAIIGDVASFGFGRHLKGDINKIWPFKQHPRALARGRLMFQRRGMATIVIGKFLGNARPFLPIIAGAMRMPFVTFLIASVVSSFIWAGVFLSPGFGLTQLWPG